MENIIISYFSFYLQLKMSNQNYLKNFYNFENHIKAIFLRLVIKFSKNFYLLKEILIFLFIIKDHKILW